LPNQGANLVTLASPISQRTQVYADLLAPLLRFFSTSQYAQLADAPDVCDFAFGNPNEPPLAEFTAAVQTWSTPQANNWFAYPGNLPGAQATVAEVLRKRRGLPFEPADIFLTNGAFAAIGVSLGALVDPGDEVIFISPPWFFYEAYITVYGARPVRIKVAPPTFDLDLAAIEAAITPQTRAILVNSPNNPTGKIYPPQTLERLAQILHTASQRNERTIYLLSDEAYSRILFDGRSYPSPTAFYPNTLLLYTFGKTLLAPGERIGYIALSPTMPQREILRNALFVAQTMTGYAFANTILQHAIADLEELSIDLALLQRKRDQMVTALREMGYDLHVPEGTFYLLVRSPWPDDVAYCDLLAAQRILCLPGAVVEQPGYFRISLTASEAMIEQALPGFAAAIRQGNAAR
jgi:aspartate aminotransferase